MSKKIENLLNGSWELESFIIEDLNKVQTPWGKNVHGLLIYTDSGHMSVSINKEMETESSNEFENIYDSILFYAGTYQVNGNQIHHHVKHASNPDRIGDDLIRFVEWSNGRLHLTTPEESFGRAILIWKRI